MSESRTDRPRLPTRRWQFSLGTLLIAMSFVALVCIALRSPTDLWSGIIFVLLSASLLAAALVMIYRQGRTRAFAVGFLVFALSYVWISERYAPEAMFNSRSRLPTTNWAVALFSLLHDKALQTHTRTIATPVLSSPVPTTYVIPSPPVAALPPSLPPALGPYMPSTPPPQTRIITTTFVQGGAVSLSTFLEVAHRSLAMLLGILGGIAAQLLYATRPDEHSP